MQKIADEYKQEAEDFAADLVSDSDGNYCFFITKISIFMSFFLSTPAYNVLICSCKLF